MSEFSITKVQKHADELYKLIAAAYPDANMFRAETEGDKAIAAAVWHSHEIAKYIGVLAYRLSKADEV